MDESGLVVILPSFRLLLRCGEVELREEGRESSTGED